MRSSLGIAMLLGVCFATAAGAFEIPERLPVELGGRFGVSMVGERDAAGFPWNAGSRSVTAASRLMLDLNAGTDRWGRFYVKGASLWDEHETPDGSVSFEFEQGDYLWARDRDRWSLAARLFSNERRYFTGALAIPVMTDRDVTMYDRHGGVRVDADAGDRVSFSLVGTLLDDRSDDIRRAGYAGVRYAGEHAHASVSYLADTGDTAAPDFHTVARAEVAGMWRGATAILSYAQSGLEGDPMFMPSGRFDWDAFQGDNITSVMPASGAAAAEFRVAAIPAGSSLDADFVYRYESTGDSYVNSLAYRRPGLVTNDALLSLRHRNYALDGRVEFHRGVRYGRNWLSTERVALMARAFLRNGTEAALRGAVGEFDDARDGRRDDHFIHGFLRNGGNKVYAGVHAMVLDRDRPGLDARFALETRVNWTANLSVYGRVVAAESGGTSDAMVWRVEFRPLAHVFATVGYGRFSIGDGPYVLEDVDVGDTGDADDVYTVTVRGDF